MLATDRMLKSANTLIAVGAVIAVMLMTTHVTAGHNPPRPQTSYECSRYALKFNAETDRWECAKGTKVKIPKETEDRLRQLKREVDARIRELQQPTIQLQQQQVQRLQQLLNQQRNLIRALQQN